jgi:hypothetical protein
MKTKSVTYVCSSMLFCSEFVIVSMLFVRKVSRSQSEEVVGIVISRASPRNAIRSTGWFTNFRRQVLQIVSFPSYKQSDR